MNTFPKRRSFRRPAAVLFLLSIATGACRADTDLTFQFQGPGGYTGAQDTYITDQFPEASLGGLTGANVGRQGTAARALLRFDLSQLQHASFTAVTGASLTLKIVSTTGTWSGQAFTLYRVSPANKAWGAGTGASGSAREDGAACWAHLAYSSILDLSGNPTHVPWAGSAGLSTATTDYVATPLATATLSSTAAAGSAVTWTFSDTSFLADWIANPSDNAGFLLKASGLESSSGVVRFATSESAAADSRPSFTISLSGYTPPPSWNISYTLSQSSLVSTLILGPDGQVVRELLHAAQRPAGANTEQWDGRDDEGNALPMGTYTWKLLSSQGIVATYQQSLGTDLPATYAPWPGNHYPVASVAADSTGVYVSGGSSEGPPLLAKIDTTGHLLWSTSFSSVDIYHGGWALSVDGGKIYLMQQNGKVQVFTGTTSAPTAPSATWNLLYDPADPADTTVGEVGSMDICARGGRFIVSYKNHDAVRWIDPATGSVLKEVDVPSPTGVTLTPDGSTAYICSGDDSIVKLPYTATSPTTVSTYATPGQVPYRLDWDASSGYLYVAFRGTDNRLRAVNPANGGTHATYGSANDGTREGGMQTGNYCGVEDIALAPDGSWWVTEPKVPPFRLAHFSTASAYPQAAFYGGDDYATSSVADPADPTAVWIDCTREKVLVKALVDYGAKTWRPQYTYSYDHPLLPNSAGAWQIVTRGGTKYFCRTPGIAVYKLAGGGLVPCAFGGKAMDGSKTNWAIPPEYRPTDGSKVYGFMWADLNDDGMAQQSEMTYDDTGNRVLAVQGGGNSSIDANLVQYGLFYTMAHTPHGPGRLAPRSWTTGGAPVYNWADVTYPTDDLPDSLGDSFGVGFAMDGSGNCYGAYDTRNETPSGYGFWSARTGGNKILKWNAAGALQWMVGFHSLTTGADPGQMRFLWRVAGFVNDCVLAVDVEESLVHIYDRDGLYVGRVLDLRGDSSPDAAYTLCGENFSGNVVKDASGNVYYLGGGTNRVQVYKLTGWDTIQRQNGTVEVSRPGGIVMDTPDPGVTVTDAWASSSAAPGYLGTGYLHDGNALKGSKSVRYVPTIPASGSYGVYLRWTSDSNRADNVPVTITGADGSATVLVNQQTRGGQWVWLGNYALAAGTGGNVLISNADTDGFVVADGVCFSPVVP